MSRRDKVEVIGEAVLTTAGMAAGIAAAAPAAAAAGATSIPMLTTVGSWVGLTIVSATPVGWFLGGGVLGGALAYGLARLVKNGARHTGKQQVMEARRQEGREQNMRSRKAVQVKEHWNRVEQMIQLALTSGKIDNQQAEKIRELAGQGAWSLKEMEGILQ